MAYGRVNILGKSGGIENLKTIDINGSGYKLIDYKRQRKVDSEKIYDFEGNVIAKLGYDFLEGHIGFVTTRYALYNISTGEKEEFPSGFQSGFGVILNEDKDYLSLYGIKNKNGELMYKPLGTSYRILYIQNDVVYFESYNNWEKGIYKYENRQLVQLAETPLQNGVSLKNVNFL